MPTLELANFVCKFGSDLVLRNLYQEIVLPAFKSREKRKWKKNIYQLHKVQELVVSTTIGEKVISRKVICGRLIKNTTLVSKQIMEGEELVQRTERLKTSPSSYFLLYVDTHKLVYINEMPFAPKISDFEYCLAWYLKKAHRKYLSGLVEKYKNQKRKTEENFFGKPTLKKLIELYPRPTLTLTSISTFESLSKFIESYGKLKNVTITLLPTNEESDRRLVYKELRKLKDEIGSDRTVLVNENTKDGLNKGEVVSRLTDIAAAGNHQIKTSGEDQNGSKLSGTNEDFRLQRPMAELPSDVQQAGEFVHAEVAQMVNGGLVTEVL